MSGCSAKMILLSNSTEVYNNPLKPHPFVLSFTNTLTILSLFPRPVMSFFCITLLLSFLSFLPAASILPAHAHEHRGALPDTWYHTRDHPVHALFRRSGNNIPTDGHNYPSVGSAGLFFIWHPPRVLADLFYFYFYFTSKPGRKNTHRICHLGFPLTQTICLNSGQTSSKPPLRRGRSPTFLRQP